MNHEQRAALWQLLAAAGFVAGEIPAADPRRTPWYVRLMLGIAGWIGALFLLGFVGIGFALVMQNAFASIVVGAAICAGAAAILRAAPANDFFGQLGLAVSLAGQVMLCYGLSRIVEGSRGGLALLIALQQGALFVLVPHFVHRVWTSWTSAFAAVYALSQFGMFALGPAAVSLAFVLVWLREFDVERDGAILRAGGYGLALATLQTCVLHGSLWLMLDVHSGSDAGRNAAAWVGAAASAAVLFVAAWQLVKREGLSLGSPQGRIALAGAAMLGAVSLKAPGVGPAVAVLVIGYANGNRVLAGLGIAAIVGYLSHYYYSLSITLLEKSILLAVTGVALLVLRLALKAWWPKEQGGAHA